ncbi:uncharacterized protein V1513DRAFT_442692 [Lipomyces chichibuensis]|uniref:uncharacterized protein n=1 Tax=Lipomyces chichibuensis TaxID=1546026 RepID=UPI0033440256
MRRQISDWFAPKNKSPLTTSDNSSANASPLSPLSSSKKANHNSNSNKIELSLRNATNGPAPGKRGASSANKTPKRESGRYVQVSKNAMTTELPNGKLQQKLTMSPMQRKMTDVEGTVRLEGLDTPKLAPAWEDCDSTPSPVRNNATAFALKVDKQSSSQVTVLSDQAPTTSPTSIVKDENPEAKENTTPTSTRSVSTSRTEDLPTPSSFRSAVERLDGDASSVTGSLSPVTEERSDGVTKKDSERCEHVKQVEVIEIEDVELVETDDSISATATMTAPPAQEHSTRPNIEASSELSSPPASLLSMTATNESARLVDMIELDSKSEYGSSQSPEPTPTPAAATRVEIAPKTATTALEEVPTICRRELRSSALASILASSRKSTTEESPTTATGSSRFVIKVPIVPPPSPSSIITCTPESLSSTSGPAKIQEPKKANMAPSSFLSSLIEKSARKPARPAETEIPSALRDLYARAAEIQRFDSLMAESKELEHQSHCLDQPRSDEAINDDDVMTAAVGVENATQMAKLLGKVESEKSKIVEFHYFDISRLEVFEIERERFPGLPAGWLSECLHDPEMRNVMFESGFVRDMIDLENKLPKSLVLWLMVEVAREPNDFLAHSYLQTLLLCDDALHADEEVLDKMFCNIGVNPELQHVDSEMTLSRVKGDDKSVRFRTHNIKFTLELLHAIVARRTYESRFFRKVMIFTIRALLDSAVGKSMYSSLSDLFSVVISRIPIESWLTEETFLLRTLFSTVTDSKERVRLLTLVPINPGTHAMHLRTKLAIAFFLNDIDFVADTIADGRLPIAKRILPELLSNPMYRLRVTQFSQQKQGGEVPQIKVHEMQDVLQPSTPPLSDSADAEQLENSVHSLSPSKLKVVVSSDPEDEADEELLETNATTDNGADDTEFDHGSEDDDDESYKVDYALLTHRIWCLNFALMTAVRLDKDIHKIKVITDFLRELNNKIFDPHARFPDRTEAKAAIQACEFRLLYSVVGGNGVRQSVIEKHFEYTKRSPRKNYKGKKRKEIEE